LNHLIKTNDVRIALTLAAKRLGYPLARWIDDKSLKSPQMTDRVILKGADGATQNAAVQPDGYFVIGLPTDDPNKLRRSDNFLEVDLATVTGESPDWGQ